MTEPKVSEGTVPPVPAIGDRIDKYRVEQVLGRGGMGVVLGARHDVLGHRVAIKLLAAGAETNATTVARFLREARATVELRSEHAVRVLDVGTLPNGSPFLVMEHLEGEDLHRLLQRRGPLPVGEAVELVLQASDAIADAHERGIVHRDLKPSNLFLTHRSEGRPLVKVLDFGISKLAPVEGEGELTETLAVLGSPGYMAPEQIRSARRADHRADIWGLGIVLYRLLCARSPFEGEGALALCASILGDDPHPPTKFRADVPQALERILLRCLEKDPNKRFQSVIELAQSLVPFAPETPTAVRFRLASTPRPPEATIDAPAPDLALRPADGTNAAVTGNAASVVPAKSRGGTIALVAIGLVGAAALVVAFVSPSAKAPEATTAPAASAPPKPLDTTASAAPLASTAHAAPIEPAAAPSPSVAAPSASASTGAKMKAPKPPPSKPPKKGSTSWGSMIDDPL